MVRLRLSAMKLRARSGGVGGIVGPAESEAWVKLLLDQRLRAEARERQVGRTSDPEDDGMVDLRVAGPGDPKGVDEAFGRLRWGGLFACVDPDPRRIRKLLPNFDGRHGFVIEQPMGDLWGGPRGLRIPGITPRAYFFVARKTHLVPPGAVSQRFTYDVRLRADPGQPTGYCVRKKVPGVDELTRRLLRGDVDLEPEEARRRAARLVEEVLPIFLTREVKVLRALQQKLPPALRGRVPRALRIRKNAAGLVDRLEMNWLRNGGPPLSQVEFARQSVELLAGLHAAGIMHLDLRPDNVVITPEGVGFVDFGSAAGVDEDLAGHRVLGPLFADMMRTSQVQRVLGDLLKRERVTSEALAAIHGRAHQGVDTFFLALQINEPGSNPELRRLIDHQPTSAQAKALESLTAAVLRPKDARASEFKTAADLRRGIDRIARREAG